MYSKPVAIIFGVGANIGAAVVKKFVGSGYRVAAVSRHAAEPATPSADGSTLPIRANLSDPSQVPAVFETVRKTWNAAPRVVVWNVAGFTPSPDKENFFSIPLADVERDLAITVTSSWAAAAEAVKGWTAGERSTFILTGNGLARKIMPIPDLTTLGTSKSGAAYWVGAADAAFKAKKWRFFYADERTAQGGAMGPSPGAQSHADMYQYLAETDENLPYYVTFTDGKYREW